MANLFMRLLPTRGVKTGPDLPTRQRRTVDEEAATEQTDAAPRTRQPKLSAWADSDEYPEAAISRASRAHRSDGSDSSGSDSGGDDRASSGDEGDDRDAPNDRDGDEAWAAHGVALSLTNERCAQVLARYDEAVLRMPDYEAGVDYLARLRAGVVEMLMPPRARRPRHPARLHAVGELARAMRDRQRHCPDEFTMSFAENHPYALCIQRQLAAIGDGFSPITSSVSTPPAATNGAIETHAPVTGCVVRIDVVAVTVEMQDGTPAPSVELAFGFGSEQSVWTTYAVDVESTDARRKRALGVASASRTHWMTATVPRFHVAGALAAPDDERLRGTVKVASFDRTELWGLVVVGRVVNDAETQTGGLLALVRQTSDDYVMLQRTLTTATLLATLAASTCERAHVETLAHAMAHSDGREYRLPKITFDWLCRWCADHARPYDVDDVRLAVRCFDGTPLPVGVVVKVDFDVTACIAPGELVEARVRECEPKTGKAAHQDPPQVAVMVVEAPIAPV